MMSTESAQTWFVPHGGKAGGDDGGVPSAIDGTRSMVASDVAMTGLETCMGAMPEVLARATDLTDVRLEQVVRLRVAIASGCYRVSAAKIADKLIGSLSGSRGLETRKYC